MRFIIEMVLYYNLQVIEMSLAFVRSRNCSFCWSEEYTLETVIFIEFAKNDLENFATMIS